MEFSMKISDIYRRKKTVITCEVFPPKKGTEPDSLYSAIAQLKELNPDFISVTYSAGGSGGSDATIDIAANIKNRYGIEGLAHQICIDSSWDQIDSNIKRMRTLGLENIMSLRGDAVSGEEPAGEFRYASDMITKIKAEYPDMCIGAAAYPEGHFQSESLDKDIENLKIKVDAGADFLVTQLFFDNRFFYEFFDRLIAAGIKIPVSAGIMPILSKAQIQKMIFMCGASLPAQIIKMLGKYENDAAGLRAAAIEYSVNQINDLAAHKVDGIHIYTMNRPEIAASCLAGYKYREV